MDKISNEWWDQYGMEQVSEMYNDFVITKYNHEVHGQLLESWDKWFQSILNKTTDKLFYG